MGWCRRMSQGRLQGASLPAQVGLTTLPAPPPLFPTVQMNLSPAASHPPAPSQPWLTSLSPMRAASCLALWSIRLTCLMGLIRASA